MNRTVLPIATAARASSNATPARPATAISRPQFGSPPWIAVFTSSEFAIAFAHVRASPLVKTAIHGGDPNWGRLIAVAGRAGVAFELTRAAVTIGSIVLFKDGRPYDDAAPLAAEYLKGTELTVGVDLGAGRAHSIVWTCDLSAEYVRINADYRT